MIPVNEATASLIKLIDGTMQAAKMNITSSKTPTDPAEPITYEGEYGKVRLEFDNNVINVKCKAEGQEWKTVAETLYDPSEEGWEEKSTKSVANAICEAVATYYGTDCVFAGKVTKTVKDNIVDMPAAGSSKKSKKKDAGDAYDAVSLANRMETIFPELKGEMIKNMEKYDMFLPEEYFETLVTPKITEAIKNNDRPVLKKVINSFNNFYNEGENDIQSLIVVSILGMNLAKDDSGLKNIETLLDKNLSEALMPVIAYLKTGAAKKKIASFESPKPKQGK